MCAWQQAPLLVKHCMAHVGPALLLTMRGRRTARSRQPRRAPRTAGPACRKIQPRQAPAGGWGPPAPAYVRALACVPLQSAQRRLRRQLCHAGRWYIPVGASIVKAPPGPAAVPPHDTALAQYGQRVRTLGVQKLWHCDGVPLLEPALPRNNGMLRKPGTTCPHAPNGRLRTSVL